LSGLKGGIQETKGGMKRGDTQKPIDHLKELGRKKVGLKVLVTPRTRRRQGENQKGKGLFKLLKALRRYTNKTPKYLHETKLGKRGGKKQKKCPNDMPNLPVSDICKPH